MADIPVLFQDTLYMSPEPDTIPVLFADSFQQNKFTLTVMNPSYTENLYLHLKIVMEDIEITRAYPAVLNESDDASTSSGITSYSAEVDVSEILAGLWSQLVDRDSLTDDQFTFPSDSEAPLQDKTGAYLQEVKFYLAYSYNDDGEIGISDYYSTGSFETKVIRGAMSRVFNAYLNNNGLTPYSYFVNSKKFLSWIPNDSKVHPRQPLLLYYLNPDGLELMLKSNIYFTDGTSETVTYNSSSAFLIECAVGGFNLRIENVDINKTIESYEVWLECADDSTSGSTSSVIQSEVRSFVVDYSFYEQNDIFFFRNSLGLFEVFWSHGYRSESIDNEKTEYVRPYVNAEYRKGTAFMPRTTFTRSYSSNTGYFTRDMKSWVADFLNSQDVFMPVDYCISPVIIESVSATVAEGGSDLFSADYEFRFAHSEMYFSDQPPVTSPFGDFNDDFNADFFIS